MTNTLSELTVTVHESEVRSTYSRGAAPVAPALAARDDWRLVSWERHPEPTTIPLGGGVVLGSTQVLLMAGPCAVENEDQLMAAAHAVAAAGATVLRGGAFKPRTSPYSFQGLLIQGLKFLDAARTRFGLRIVTEALDQESLGAVAEVADMIQIGARNMQNFSLLSAAGATKKPVLLKRGFAATIDEWLYAAEYVMAAGSPFVALAERGIRTFEPRTRNTLDLAAVPLLRALTHLPIVVDPSHAAGERALVPALSRAAVAAGADALIVEVHPNPAQALSDGPQSLTPHDFTQLARSLAPIAASVDRVV